MVKFSPGGGRDREGIPESGFNENFELVNAEMRRTPDFPFQKER